MDARYPSQNYEGTCSHDLRPTNALLQTLRLAESALPAYDTASYSSGRPASSQGFASPVYLSPALSQTSLVPLPQSHFALPAGRLGEEADWYETPPTRALNVTCTPPTPQLEAMSAMAVHYDQGFGGIGARSSLTWPVLDHSGTGLGLSSHHPHHPHYHQVPQQHHYHEMAAYGSESSLPSPSRSRSATASPPRSIGSANSAEQCELRRQRDQMRRNTKLHIRSQRSVSGSSMYSPPAFMAERKTGASSMPIYSTAPPQMPLLASPSNYLSSFSSPPIPAEHGFSASYPGPAYMADNSPYPSTSAPSMSSLYGRPMMPADPTFIYHHSPPLGGHPMSDAGHVRLIQSRPKPQCWEHGCNGRLFSTSSNLLRHQREKSGQAAKASCPICGAEFTRKTARNGHLHHAKCKSRRDGDGGGGSSSASTSPADIKAETLSTPTSSC